jgi:hypothetical protein
MPPTGKVNPQHPEKKEHTKNLNDALSDALEKWNPGDGTEVVVKIEATLTPNPGGISQYRVILVPKT